MHIPQLLEGDALLWFKQTDKVHPFEDWKNFKHRLFTRWTGQTMGLGVVREMQACRQGNQSIIEFVAQFRQLISLQQAAGTQDSEGTYVDRFITNLNPTYAKEAHKFLTEYVVRHKTQSSPDGDEPHPMLDALCEYLIQMNTNITSRRLHAVVKTKMSKKQQVSDEIMCPNCHRLHSRREFCPRVFRVLGFRRCIDCMHLL